jgi:iron complex outermembrane receptor protein
MDSMIHVSRNTLRRTFGRVLHTAAALCLFAAVFTAAHAQTQIQSIQGSVADPKGAAVAGVKIAIRNDATGTVVNIVANAQGRFAAPALAPGSYTVDAVSAGFRAEEKKVVVAAGQPTAIAIVLQVAGATDEISVDAEATHSVAAAYAPMDALLDERSARTEITSAFIQNFTSPLADYGEAVEMAPGTFTTNGNGVGLGQSKTYFRGFPDGDYDIDFDGIPFYDTNTPTHHSWAFFPSQWLGGIDFDRSPGTASTIGPTPFGGSIHLLSRDLSPVQNIRGGISFGSWGTLLADVQYDSGFLLPSKKLAMFLDVQHMDTKGYESNNFQNREAGSIKVQYKFSEKTILSGFSGVVFLDANTPNFNATRCQLYGTGSNYTCITGSGAYAVTSPYTGAGIRFYLADNTNPYSGLDYQYNKYHVPTDFEYVELKTVLPFKISMDVKPYTYNYDNSEVYSNTVPITEQTNLPGSVSVTSKGVTTNYYQGVAIVPCNGSTLAPGAVAPCGVDKYNSYRKYGETLQLSQTSKLGTFRAGLWYEWADTNRHQYPADPLNGYQRTGLPNFAEMFWTNSYQPYGEFEFHPLDKLVVTAGTKFAQYTIDTKQFADNGKTIGNLGTSATVGLGNPTAFITQHGSYGAWLPSIDANYRIRSNWSAYGQLSTGSIVPPSNVYDFNQGTTGHSVAPLTPPRQQRSTTYQIGSVVKLKRVTLDLDAYHIKFQNTYSTITDVSTGEPVSYPQPGTITRGIEGEGNLYFGHGFSAYLNATVGRAFYTGGITIYPTGAKTNANPLWVVTPPNTLWVATTPSDTETEALTYQNHGFDFGFFNKRVGSLRQDDGAYHNQGIVNPFQVSNAFLNYTIRRGSRFDQTKIRLSVNNLLDQHNLTSLGIKAGALTQNILVPHPTRSPTPIPSTRRDRPRSAVWTSSACFPAAASSSPSPSA